MRQEDKEVDGFELERAEERRRENELVEEDEEELHDLDGQPEFERDSDRTATVSAAMHKILEREHIVVNDLDLSQRELRALDALKTAVEGRDQELSGFVFAEDRRSLLEQALAVLQPDLAKMELLGGKAFEELVHEVAELREQLESLEEAQEEVDARKHAAAKTETDDKDDDDKDDDDDDKPRASTLTGPDHKEAPKPPSTLTGPERKDEPKPPTTLTGSERKDEPKPPTTLGDPKEIAAAATPSWKRR